MSRRNSSVIIYNKFQTIRLGSFVLEYEARKTYIQTDGWTDDDFRSYVFIQLQMHL